MRITFSAVFSVIAASLLAVGCAGPERKLGRGINNATEFARGGEMDRSIEQASIFNGPEVGATTGVIHGFDQSVKRTFVGFYEMVTFPFPNRSGKDYGPVLLPENPVYPDSYRPNVIADTIVSPDSSLGFGGGDVAPFVPGSRFRIFDN
jgi:putative exosortase-associated protein (TIGR04073 family)